VKYACPHCGRNALETFEAITKRTETHIVTYSVKENDRGNNLVTDYDNEQNAEHYDTDNEDFERFKCTVCGRSCDEPLILDDDAESEEEEEEEEPEACARASRRSARIRIHLTNTVAFRADLLTSVQETFTLPIEVREEIAAALLHPARVADWKAFYQHIKSNIQGEL